MAGSFGQRVVGLLGLTLVLLSAVPSAHANPTEAERAMRHATTYHHWARATENSKVLHQEAQKQYEKALESGHPPTHQAAQAGLRQVRARIDNSHDIFRNAVWAAWWMAGHDTTLETYDDARFRALGNAWEVIELQTRPKAGTPQIPVVVREAVIAANTAKAEERESLDDSIRDELLALVWNSAGRYSVHDALGATTIPTQWKSALRVGNPDAEAYDALAEALEVSTLLIIDAELVDKVPQSDTHLAAYRAQITARKWKRGKGFTETHVATGIGSDAVERTWAVFGWCAFVVFAGILLVGLRHRIEAKRNASDAKQASFARSLELGGIAFLGGMILGGGAAEVSEGFLQEWGMLSFLLETEWLVVPYFPALAWPFVHGLVVMVSPIVLLAWGTLKLPPNMLDRFGDPTTQLSVVAPAAQAGALTWLFAPLVIALPGRGWMVAVPLSVGALSCSLFLGPAVAKVLRGKRLALREVWGVVLPGLGLLLLLPLGLFNDLHWWMGGIAVVLSACGARLGIAHQEELEAAADKELEVVDLKASGTLKAPTWLDVVNIGAELEVLKDGGGIIIHGPAQGGVSRCLAQLNLAWDDSEIDHKIVHTPSLSDEGGIARPFSLATELLKVLGVPGADLAEQEARIVKAGSVIGKTGSLASSLPGLGPLLGMLPEDGGNVSRTRVIRDGVRACSGRLENRRTLLIIEDAQWADASSLELIKSLVETFPRESLYVAVGFGGEELSDAMLALQDALQARGACSKVSVPALTPELMTQFVGNCGVAALPEEVIQQLQAVSGGSPGLAIELLASLRSKGLLRASPTDRRVLVSVEGLTAETLLAAIPTEYLAAERERLSELDPGDLLLLECAADCGRRFTVGEMSAGLGRSNVDVASVLDRLEQATDPPIVEDLEGHEDIFRFVSGLTWQALRDRLHHGDGEAGGSREFVRNFRARAARDLAQSSLVTPDRLLGHAMAGGSETRDVAIQAAARVALDAARRMAWPEVVDLYKRVEHLAHGGESSDRMALGLTYGAACRFIGGQENREEAFRQYREAVDSALSGESLPERVSTPWVVMGWCEAQFEEKDADELAKLEADCEALIADARLDETSRLILRFYSLLSHAVRTEAEGWVSAVSPLLTEVRALDPCRERDRLTAIMLQTLASRRLTDLRPKDEMSGSALKAHSEAVWAEVSPLLEEAEVLTSKLGDHKGQATTLSIRADHSLIFSKDYVHARKTLLSGLEIIEGACIDADVPQFKNKLSIALAGLGREATGDESRRLFEESIALAWESVRLAREYRRENDSVHATKHLMSLLLDGHRDGWISHDPVADLDDLGTQINSKVLWSKVTVAGATGQMRQNIARIREACGERIWMAALEDCLGPT